MAKKRRKSRAGQLSERDLSRVVGGIGPEVVRPPERPTGIEASPKEPEVSEKEAPPKEDTFVAPPDPHITNFRKALEERGPIMTERGLSESPKNQPVVTRDEESQAATQKSLDSIIANLQKTEKEIELARLADEQKKRAMANKNKA